MLNGFRESIESNHIWTPKDIKEILGIVRTNFRFSQKSIRHPRYFNVPCAFDIETTSFIEDDKGCCYPIDSLPDTELNKDYYKYRGTMYAWTFGIYGQVMIGRTWDEFIEMIDELASILKIKGTDKRLIIYVHNLGFEFQWFNQYFEWDTVFSLDSREPVYALTKSNIEFRCSYKLTNAKLEIVGKDLKTYKINKLVGDLDYSLLRHSLTPLTDKELSYCVNDVKIVMAHIAECIESDNGICNIPLTNTGYVRRYVKASTIHSPDKKVGKSYRDLIKNLTITLDEYEQLKRGFQGGFTHASPFAFNKVIENVTSFDFISSYPAVMIARQFPMSKSRIVDFEGIPKENRKSELIRLCKQYCVLFDTKIYGLTPKIRYENYISLSKCFNWNSKGTIVSNGRIVECEYLETTLTEQDFLIITKFYDFKQIAIENCRIYDKGYLPKPFVESILKLYHDKTTLKGLNGFEAEYMISKAMLNSCYGMCVTDPIRDTIIYDKTLEHLWKVDSASRNKAIEEYNQSKGRFLFYPWGVWVTAYARVNLFTGIMAFEGDYIYSDTDSIKVKNASSHMEYINDYNTRITYDMDKAMDYHGLPKNLTRPQTNDGIPKPLGVWDFDGEYSRFKTLGAKRYLVEYSADFRNGDDKGKISLTVAGLNKKIAVPWLIEQYGKDGIFEAFKRGLIVPKNATGKKTHEYIDFKTSGNMVDYLGNSNSYTELTSLCLSGCTYNLSISQAFVDYCSETLFKYLNGRNGYV